MSDVEKLRELIADAETATVDRTAWVLERVVVFAHGQHWVDLDEVDRALGWIEDGAYLDAALTLVPEGWSYELRVVNIEGQMEARAQVNWGKAVYHEHMPLALCIAALKARLKEMEHANPR